MRFVNVLDGIDAGDVAALCRESLENGWKPSGDMVDRILAVLKAALPKVVENGKAYLDFSYLLFNLPSTCRPFFLWILIISCAS
jgi:hypothetical protein